MAGTFIVQPSLRDTHEVCQVRRGNEWEATGIATNLMAKKHLQDLRDEIIEAEKQATAGNFQTFFETDARLHQQIVRPTGSSRARPSNR